MGKHEPLRRIDRRPPNALGGLPLKVEPPTTPSTAPPAPAPTELSLTTDMELIGASYFSYIDVSFQPPDVFTPAQYELEMTWTGPAGTMVRREFVAHDDQRGADFLPQTYRFQRVASGVQHSIRVRAMSLGNAYSGYTASVSIVAYEDTIAPGPVTNLQADFSTASCIIRWTNPLDADLKDCVVSIYINSTKTSLLLQRAIPATIVGSSVQQSFEFSLEDNRRVTGNSPLPSLYIEVQARDQRNNLSTVANVTATNAPPVAPTGLFAEFSGRECAISWNVSSGVRDLLGYRVTIDGVVQPLVGGTSLSYTFEKNRLDHGGVADPVLDISLVNVDVFGQVSATAATTTATNAPPAPPTISSFTCPFSELIVSLTYTKPDDFDTFEYVFKRGSMVVATIYNPNDLISYRVDQKGTYTVEVRALDAFGQFSTVVTSSAVAADPLTISELRQAASYTDSQNNTEATLSILKDDVGSVFIAYPASQWNWTKQSWPWQERSKVVTLAFNGGISFVIGFSADDVAYTYYYGAFGSDGATLTANTTNLATAQASPAVAPVAGTLFRVQIPALVNARYVVVYHRLNGVIYGLGEFFARRLTQTDDLDAEAVRAINIAANAIVADKIAAGAIDGKTITGAIIRTPDDGLRIDASGIAMLGENATFYSLNPGRSLVWRQSVGGDVVAAISTNTYTFGAGDSTRNLHLRARTGAGISSTSVNLQAEGTHNSSLSLSSHASNPALASAVLQSGGQTAIYSYGQAGYLGGTSGWQVQSNLSVGSGLTVSGSTALGGLVWVGAVPNDPNIRTLIRGVGTGGGTRGLRVTDSTGGNVNLDISDNGAGYLRAASWTFGSDERLKDEIQDDVTDIARLTRLKVRSFKYKGSEKRSLGFVAQEFQEHFPELVEEGPDGILGIRTGELIPLIIRKLIQIDARLDRLEKAKKS
jgi:hypothetical protein